MWGIVEDVVNGLDNVCVGEDDCVIEGDEVVFDV